MRPLIGIPCHASFRAETGRPIYGNNRSYVHALEAAGGVPVLIPMLNDFTALDPLLARLDGLLLPGGVDMQPSRYGEEKHPLTEEADPQLDQFELSLTSWALKEDVPILVQQFAEQVCAQNNWKPLPFTAEAIEELKGNSWPGNVRELRNVVERLILLATGPEVTVDTVDQALPHTLTTAPSLAGSGTLAERAQAFEREVILAELKRHQFHVTNAAKVLGLERSHLYKKAEQLGIDLRSLRHESSDAGGTT